MGTNYYIKTNECKCCNRHDRVHIGKASYGWKFIFEGSTNIKTFENWKWELQLKNIINEYGEQITYKQFIELVEAKQSEKEDNTEYCREHGINPDLFWTDDKGYNFMSGDFS